MITSDVTGLVTIFQEFWGLQVWCSGSPHVGVGWRAQYAFLGGEA